MVTLRRPSREPDYRSGFERRIGRYLADNGVAFTYESLQLLYKTKKRGAVCAACDSTNILVARTYTPDFCLTTSGILIESKGRFTAADRAKMKAIKAFNTDKDIRLLFQYNNWTTKKKLMRYTDWAERYGFPCHVSNAGIVPDEWLK